VVCFNYFISQIERQFRMSLSVKGHISWIFEGNNRTSMIGSYFPSASSAAKDLLMILISVYIAYCDGTEMVNRIMVVLSVTVGSYLSRGCCMVFCHLLWKDSPLLTSIWYELIDKNRDIWQRITNHIEALKGMYIYTGCCKYLSRYNLPLQLRCITNWHLAG